jgi:GntR family transcriptional regulator
VTRRHTFTTVTLNRVGIDRAAPEYLYLQLAALIRDQIRSGDLPARSAIPSFPRLAAEYDLALATVRKAVAVLVSEGLLVTYPGRGTFVAGQA